MSQGLKTTNSTTTSVAILGTVLTYASAYVGIRQHASAYVSVRQRASTTISVAILLLLPVI